VERDKKLSTMDAFVKKKKEGGKKKERYR